MTLEVTGTLTASGPTDTFEPPRDRDFNISVWGTWTGTFKIERQLTPDMDWLPFTFGGEEYEYNANISEPFGEIETGVSWRLNWTRLSGTLEYRFSGVIQGRPR